VAKEQKSRPGTGTGRWWACARYVIAWMDLHHICVRVAEAVRARQLSIGKSSQWWAERDQLSGAILV